jgi:hypothetical protein
LARIVVPLATTAKRMAMASIYYKEKNTQILEYFFDTIFQK